MASVHFSLRHEFDAAPASVWRELVDWEGHADWIPATRVQLHCTDPGVVGAEFTAWSGYRPLVLEDRMRVDSLEWDEGSGRGYCLVTKLGPVLTGTASFTVEPNGAGTSMNWVEDVVVPRVPQFLAPVAARIGVAGFRFGMRRLARQLAEHVTAAADSARTT